MIRLSAHIGYLYADLPLPDRLAAAAAGGFTAVEHPEPFAIPASEMRRRLEGLGLTLSQVTSGMGEAGEKGLASLIGREDAFRAGFLRGLDYALAVGCPFVHPMAGVPAGSPLAATETYLANIGWAVRRCAGTAVRVLVEAITIPGYHMATLDAAVALQDRFGPDLALLFDSYHAAQLGLDPVAWLSGNIGRVGHIHIADHPGRHEPGTGRIDFDALLGVVAQAGYGGAIGFEYIPSTSSTADSATFLRGWRPRLSPPAASLSTGARP